MASKVNIIGIVAWVLVGVLAIGAGALGFLGWQQSKGAEGLRGALAQVAATAGVQELPADSLKDAAGLSSAVQQVQAAIQGTQQELATTKDALAASQTEASGAKAEMATLTQGAQEQAAKVEGLTKDLAAKDEAIASAKAETEKAAQEIKAAQEAAEQQKAELEGNLASLKTRMEEETARLQAELEAARAASVVSAAPTEGTGEGAAAPAGEVLVDALAEAPAGEPAVDEMPGRVIGQSEMLSLIRYSAEDQSLRLCLLDGQELIYRDVPQNVYDQLIADGSKVDMIYKFKIQGAYKSLPPDSTVVRKFWKWQRRHPARGDVRVIEPPAPLVIVDEASEAEAAPAAEEPTPAAEGVVPAVEEAVPSEK